MEKEPTNKDVLQAIQSLSGELRSEFKDDLRDSLSELRTEFKNELRDGLSETKAFFRQEIGETKELAKNSYTLAEKSYQLNVDTLRAINIFAQHTEDSLQELRSDVSSLKTDVSELKYDVSELKDDVSAIKLRQDNVPYRFELNELDHRVTKLEQARTV